MTKEECYNQLLEIAKIRDCEERHAKADDLLIEYIGDEDIKELFESIDKWYA
jgi:hypothetical protein